MPYTTPMPTRQLADLLGRVAIALSAGIGLRRAWKGEVERAPARWRSAMEAVGDALDRGAGLAEALAAAGDTFPALVRGMAEVGERTGHEAETLRDLARALDHSVRTRRALLSSLVWPAFQLAIALLVIAFLIVVAGAIRDERGGPVDILGLGLVGAPGLAAYVSVVLSVAIAALVGGRALLASWSRHGVARRLADRVPVFGAAARAAEVAQWCRASSLAAAAGLDAGRLVRLASSVAPGLTLDPERVEARLRAGATLADVLRAARGFPPPVVEGVAVGELTGSTAETLDRIAGQYDDEAQRGFEASARGFGFLVWVGVAALVILVIFRIFSFYVGAIQAVAGGR